MTKKVKNFFSSDNFIGDDLGLGFMPVRKINRQRQFLADNYLVSDDFGFGSLVIKTKKR